jgi:Ca-activated chloride channel family protein
VDTAQEIEQSIENQYQKSKTINKKSQNYNELYGTPLFLALLLFLTIHTRAIKYLFILLAFFGVEAQASFWDTLRLSQAYSAYNSNDFNLSQKYLLNIHKHSLESQVALASSYYKAQRYQKALSIYQSIRTTAPKTKQMLYYNIGNCYSKLNSYKKAKKSYIKALQLGNDADSSYNLSRIILLEEQSSLSFAKPQAEGGESTQRDSEESSEKSSDSNQNSGSGGGNQKSKSDKEKSKKTLLESSPSSKHPTSSKLYELINKGYIYEKEPW